MRRAGRIDAEQLTPYCAKSASAELCGVQVAVVEETADLFAPSNSSLEALDLGRRLRIPSAEFRHTTGLRCPKSCT